MTEPRIQYARTEDGVSIAFSTLGEGTPLVCVPEPALSHIQLEWQIPVLRRWYERLAGRRMIVRYDGRGTGLSDREVVNHSLEASVLDLEAVVNHLDFENFALYSISAGGFVAIAYAAKHPARVSHLILWNSATRSSDFGEGKHVRALGALLDVDWEMATETWARAWYPGAPGDVTRSAAAFMRASTTPDVLWAVGEALRSVDIRPLLPTLKLPTLVLARRKIPNYDHVRLASELASRIPGSRLVMLEGSEASPAFGDTAAVLNAIDEFLGDDDEATAGASLSGLVTILFTDIEGSTAMTQRLGDAKAREVLREHERITREALKAHGGSEVKTMGDGFMASFGSAVKALECAIAIQQAFDDRNNAVGAGLDPPEGAASSAPTEAVRVRIGLNAGEPIAEDDDLHGTAVITAARIAALAQGGEILVSDVVRQLVAGKGFLFNDRGDHALKGFEDPVRAWEARWQEE